MPKYKNALSSALEGTQAIKPADEEAKKEKAPKTPAGREGLVGVTFWVTPETRKKIKMTAIALEYSQQALLDEAIEDLFIKLNVE